MQDAAYWINKLALSQHEEGGWYRLIYRSNFSIPATLLPPPFSGPRPAATTIYFLLEAHRFSAMHRIASDEIWHFYAGGSLIVYEIDANGILTLHRLGSNVDAGDSLVSVVKAGSWFGAKVVENEPYSLVGCTVAPGFDYAEFELAEREHLLSQFPEHTAIITALTR